MEKETIARLFSLLNARQKHEESADLIVKTIRKCQKKNGFLCDSCEQYNKCKNLNDLASRNREIGIIDMNILRLIQINALDLAKTLGATRSECGEWLCTINASYRRSTGENNSIYISFANEIGVKL